MGEMYARYGCQVRSGKYIGVGPRRVTYAGAAWTRSMTCSLAGARIMQGMIISLSGDGLLRCASLVICT